MSESDSSDPFDLGDLMAICTNDPGDRKDTDHLDRTFLNSSDREDPGISYGALLSAFAPDSWFVRVEA